MLSELTVSNLVIVAQARVCPGRGLTVISGETGAGKSLILDALDLLLGGRAQGDLVGPAGDAATISAVFAVDAAVARAVELACGVGAVDGDLILRRRLAGAGRSQAWINDVPVTITALKAVGALLVDIRAQHDSQRLGDVAHQLVLLDSFAGLDADAAAYRDVHARCQALESELAGLDGGERESLKELDYLRFQQAEFTALDPRPGELAGLEQRLGVLSSAEEYRQLAAEAAEALGEDERAAARIIAKFARRLSGLPDPGLADAGIACTQALEAVQEAARLCAAAADRLHADPQELRRTEERIDAWYQLMRKHGEGEAALLAARERIDQRIAELAGLGARRAAVAEEAGRARDERQRRGAALAKAREKAFARLAKVVHAELSDLNMPKAQLTLDQQPGEPSPLGTVRQEFLIRTNPGLPAGRLREVASGGEASRLTLALAVALADHERTPVLVFDEIDSGVGGRLGASIGSKLARIARDRTVIAVTHTPQLAAAAQRHYVARKAVRKAAGGETTATTIEELTGERRTAEIAEMLGGGAAALGQAKALLAGAPR